MVAVGVPDFPLRTARLVVRPYVDTDLADLADIQRRPEVMRYLYGEPRDLDEVRIVLGEKIEQRVLAGEGDRLSLAVEWTETGRVVGEVSLVWRSAQHRQAEIGFVFHPDAWGKGLAVEAATVVLDLAFAGYALHRVAGRCDARNEASARLMERLHMRREAHFVQNEWFKGEWGDELVYAVLAHEWQT
jgi:RimJ/RimL family protein N-acetyltransferase